MISIQRAMLPSHAPTATSPPPAPHRTHSRNLPSRLVSPPAAPPTSHGGPSILQGSIYPAPAPAMCCRPCMLFRLGLPAAATPQYWHRSNPAIVRHLHRLVAAWIATRHRDAALRAAQSHDAILLRQTSSPPLPSSAHSPSIVLINSSTRAPHGMSS
ncbi:hypothetical protein BDV95DRAFT_217345 [Massariosphaeria phaeospora]|uniref:Uncharacterized protein n=1 Tax=Massariosphaeria phaeospora TaxID=100035 RepID=A0A7C8MVL7_9PLEO|nr:hypothetical protein BDV95DRAFT_217345 [Massariosphaeria phaeospora]